VVARDPEKTRRRLLDAATAEFAAFGIAGARVDRIATNAGSNKAMIYTYFGNKDQLFDRVFAAQVGAYLELARFDAADLPGYAGRLFDYFEDHPAASRLASWYRLERPHGASLDAVLAVNRVRLNSLDRAQREGTLARHFSPVELLALVQSTATTWASMNPEFVADAPGDRGRRRDAVVDAVRRLVRAGL
jgi:AcrR family transcriptional regulator